MKKIKIINKSNNPLPSYKTKGSAGMDLMAELNGEHTISIEPGERALIKTGLFMEIPENYEVQIRSRSGLALKEGVIVLNSPGTIDSDYRGEIGIILQNNGKYKFMVNQGDRIAQAVVARVEQPELAIVESFEELSETERGAGGYGSTGK